MIGQVLGHYRILEKIGSGGMGEVFCARDDRLERDVAVKVLKSSLVGDPDRLRRFDREARAAAALSHPNIVAIYDIGMHNGAPYIVSELLEGETLRQRLLAGQLSVRQAADFGMQAAEALVCAHEKYIIHRDLKPENLFITRDNRVKVLDFGIAKLMVPDINGDSSGDLGTTQTRVGTVLGTVGYMSPEQLRAKTVDHRSDIFSLGTILYEMATGKRAFSGATDVDTMLAVLQQEPPDMAESGQNVPTPFQQIIRHCLEKEPGNRFQSARDLAFALSTISGTTTTKHFLPPRSVWIRMRRLLPWVAAVLLTTVAGIAVGKSCEPPPSPQYRRLTFERGTVYSARFTPDGKDVLYGAAWNGKPLQLFSSVHDSPLSRPLGMESMYLLAVSRTSELAVAVKSMPGARRDFIGGVLARMPLAGGAPRELLQDVRWADWSLDGNLAVVHQASGHSRLEYPTGNVLYQTAGWISNIRFSPKGERIAFMEHPIAWDDGGSVCVVDLAGKRSTLSAGWKSEDGLAWSANGEEVWFTASDNTTSGRILWAVGLDGKKRKILAMPGGFTLHDIANDGQVLITMDSERLAMEWTGKNENQVQDLSWYDWSIAKDISADGQWVLFEEGSEPAGPNDAVAIRKIDGSPPIRLGEGTAGGLSSDGKWAISVVTAKPPSITLLPVGPGEPRRIAVPELEELESGAARFLPDGKRIVVNGRQAGGQPRSYLVDIEAPGKIKPLTPPGIYANLPSPDGKYIVGSNTFDRHLTAFPVEAGSPIRLAATDPPFSIVQWSADSRGLYVYRQGEIPLHISRIDIATGKMQPVRELTPADRAGVMNLAPVVSNYQGSEFTYSYYQILSVMYVISGLR